MANRALMAVVLIVAVTAAFEVSAQEEENQIARLDWLGGCWEQTSPHGTRQEQWMAPLGKTMVGMSRTVVGGRTIEHEYMRIEERDGALVYIALPSGQREASFKQIELTDSSVVFEDPAHDFPQRIRYRRRGDGSILAQIEGEQDGTTRVVDFPLRPAPCDRSALVTPVESGQRPSLSSSETAAVRTASRAYASAWLTNDPEQVMATLTDDAVLSPSGNRFIEGTEAIREFWWPKDSPPSTISEFVMADREVSGFGDLAYVRGTFSLEFDYDGKAYSNAGNYLSILKRQPDGSWRISHHMWNDHRR